MEQHQRLVYSLALRMLHDPQAAEDAAQDTFLAAFRRFHDFRGENARAWVLRIATNTCYDALRRAGRRPTVSLEPPDREDAVPLEVADPSRGPEDSALASERERALGALLMELAPEHRSVLILSDVHGLSYEEIAEATGASLGTVKSRLSRARARMRELLKGQRELFPLVQRLTE